MSKRHNSTAVRLEGILKEASTRHPDYTRQYEDLYILKGRNIDWPNWIFVPRDVVSLLSEEKSGGGQRQGTIGGDGAILHHLAAWRLTQGIYRFEPELFEAMKDTKLGDSPLPCEVLLRLPEWAVYIDFEERMGKYLGVFVSLDWQIETNTPYLELLFDVNNGSFLHADLPLHTNMSVQAILSFVRDETIRRCLAMSTPIHEAAPLTSRYAAALGHILSNDAPPIEFVINLVLYLCSDEPDAARCRAENAHRSRPRPVKTKKGPRLFLPAKPHVVVVGKEMTAKQSAMKEEPEQAAVQVVKVAKERGPITGHVRKAHPHGYWTGPRKGPRIFEVRWMPPILVAPRIPIDNQGNTPDS